MEYISNKEWLREEMHKDSNADNAESWPSPAPTWRQLNKPDQMIVHQTGTLESLDAEIDICWRTDDQDCSYERLSHDSKYHLKKIQTVTFWWLITILSVKVKQYTIFILNRKDEDIEKC